MTIAPLKARRSARLNGGSAAGSSTASSSSSAPSDSSSEGSDDLADTPSEAPLHGQSGGSSLVDPVVLQRKAGSAARQLKHALADAEEAVLAKKIKAHKDGLDGVDLIRGLSGSVAVEGSEEWKWGRAMSDDWLSALLAFIMMSCVPFVVLLMLHSCRKHQCSLQDSLVEAATQGVGWSWLPPTSVRAWSIYVVWFVFQLLLYRFMPGPVDYGQPTNAGYTLAYRVNGWNCWWVSHAVLFVCVFVLKLFPATIVADEWFALFVVLNFFGYFWTAVAYFKAWLAPTHAEDCKWSGSIMYDVFMGVEHNPRVSEWFDFKLFFNGRPGILGWSVINLSFAFKQYAEHGHVSNSMLAVHLLHLTYILDFFYHEGWYLRTIDIAHDHFGFYLAWGDTVFLPMTYTLQSLYLLYNPVQLSTPALLAVLALGWSGYGVFRAVNNQKDRVRLHKGQCNIWGRPARYLEVHYSTKDGPRTSLLLTSGFWGMSRHFNYVGDLMISSAMCLACGTQHLLPYFYIIFMTIVLLHRVGRDHARCSAKYGKYWDEYCRIVPYKVLPYVY